MYCLLLFATAAEPAHSQNQNWILQIATSSHDDLGQVAADGVGGVYACGWTSGSLGAPNVGSTDVWLSRYDSAGSCMWSRQFGTPNYEYAFAAASDGSGGVIFGGCTNGNLGAPLVGNFDAWLGHYSGAGLQTWLVQFGTAGYETVHSAASDGAGGAFVCGGTTEALGGASAGLMDAWLARYDGAGNRAWIRQLGTSTNDDAYSVAPDGAGGVFACGGTGGVLGGASAGNNDAVLMRYDGFGNQIWIRQFGTAGEDSAAAVSPDGLGGAFAGGFTAGALGAPSAGGRDIWLARYDAAGNRMWVRQFGSSVEDELVCIASDSVGGAFVGGVTMGDVAAPSAGDRDVWLAGYDGAGTRIWIRQFGTNSYDLVAGAAPALGGRAYFGGSTGGSLGGPFAGGFYDAWLTLVDGPCATPTASCTPGTTTHGCTSLIAGVGQASANSGSGFTITVGSVEGQQSGLIFYGVSGPIALPWGTGTSFLCVGSPLQRTPLQYAGGTYGVCDGTLSIDWNSYVASNPLALGNPFAGGEVVHAQGWFRDPAAARGSNLSNAIRFPVCP